MDNLSITHSTQDLIDELVSRGAINCSHPDLWFSIINKAYNTSYSCGKKFPTVLLINGDVK